MKVEYGPDTQFAGTPKALNGGNFLVWRKNKGGAKQRSLSKRLGGSYIPNFRHETYEAAVKEAQRLCALFPESTFIIIQEVATVKIREPEMEVAA
jgi:hypothetical protein